MPSVAAQVMIDEQEDAARYFRASAVRRYLRLLEGQQRGRGRPRLSAEERLRQAERTLEQEGDPLARLEARQRRLDAKEDLARESLESEFEQAERQFVECAQEWASAEGVTWPAFREVGVPASVLRQAGIKQKHRPKVGRAN